MEEKEEIKRLIEEIKENDLLVIVEGPKDARELKKFGIAKIITLSRKPLFAVVEEAANNEEVAILTDLDAKGKELYHKLSRDLQSHGVKINNKLREYLFTTKLSHIEGLGTYLK